jgi:formylglycine-generating enzyme required for sulfatase activity
MGSRESAEELARAFEGEGAQTEWFEGEHPQHRVRLTKPLHLGAYEVTQQQYERVMGVNPSRFKGPQHPVESVGWGDAVTLCHKLSALPEEKVAGRTYRLPTEAEWEYSCRAGSTTRYSYGVDPVALGDYAWFSANSSRSTHPVGERQPNAWGLYDMHGNVWECSVDWYSEYTNTQVDDPTGPTTGSLRVFRGGSWLFPATDCRSAGRFRSVPDYRFCELGFRVALDVTKKVEPPKDTN